MTEESDGIPGQEPLSVERIRVILDGKPSDLDWLLSLVQKNGPEIAKLDVGNGWGCGQLGRRFAYVRRTKTGFSAVLTSDEARPAPAAGQTPGLTTKDSTP